MGLIRSKTIFSMYKGLPQPLEPLQREEPPSNLPTSLATVVCSRHRHRWMRWVPPSLLRLLVNTEGRSIAHWSVFDCRHLILTTILRTSTFIQHVRTHAVILSHTYYITLFRVSHLRWWISCALMWIRFWSVIRSCQNWTTGPMPCRLEPLSSRPALQNWRINTGGRMPRWGHADMQTCLGDSNMCLKLFGWGIFGQSQQSNSDG